MSTDKIKKKSIQKKYFKKNSSQPRLIILTCEPRYKIKITQLKKKIEKIMDTSRLFIYASRR